MKSDIKTIYLDTRGGQHESKSDAAKANRLITAASRFVAGLTDGIHHDRRELFPRCVDGGIDEHSKNIIEYARAVVAIHGMKDVK